MAPRTNFQLARVFGIRIGVGVSWFVVLFLFVILSDARTSTKCSAARTRPRIWSSVAVVLSFFVSVILHELGHALVARRNGLSVAGIDLWAFGGLTRMREMASTPGVQFRVAIAGPAGDARGDRRLRARRRPGRAGRALRRSRDGQRPRAGDAGAGVAELAGDRQRARAACST